MPPCGASARGQLLNFTGQRGAGGCGGASGRAGGRGGCLARPWPPRPAAAACPALPPPTGRGSRACVGRFFTQQGLPGQLLAHWRLARSLNAQPGARPPARRLRQVGGHVRQPPQRPDPLRELRQQPLQSSSRKCSWSAVPAWLAGGLAYMRIFFDPQSYFACLILWLRA